MQTGEYKSITTKLYNEYYAQKPEAVNTRPDSPHYLTQRA